MTKITEVSWVKVANQLDVETFPDEVPSFERDIRYPASDSDVQFVTDRYEEGLTVEGPLTLGALAYIGMRAESEAEALSHALVMSVERERQARQAARRQPRPDDAKRKRIRAAQKIVDESVQLGGGVPVADSAAALGNINDAGATVLPGVSRPVRMRKEDRNG